MHRLLALALIALILPLPAASAEAEAPVNSIGDRWQSESRTPDGVVVPQTLAIRDEQDVELGGETHAAYETVLLTNSTRTLNGQTVRTESLAVALVRVSDGAQLGSETTSRVFRPGQAMEETRRAVTYAAPCPRYQWPLVAGAAWDVTCTATVRIEEPGEAPQEREETLTQTYSVVAREDVRVPAGTFDAYRVRILQEDRAASQAVTEWYAPAACGVVKTTTPTQFGELTTELHAFSCLATGEGSLERDAATPSFRLEPPALSCPSLERRGSDWLVEWTGSPTATYEVAGRRGDGSFQHLTTQEGPGTVKFPWGVLPEQGPHVVRIRAHEDGITSEALCEARDASTPAPGALLVLGVLALVAWSEARRRR